MGLGFDVLLVSDEKNATAGMVEGLISAGAREVRVFAVDEGFLKSLSEQSVDLVVLDVKRPTLTLFEQFSMMNEYCPKPIVCFSEERDTRIIEKSVKAGVTAYVVEGKDMARLKPIIDVAMMRFSACQAVKKELAQVKDKLSQRALVEKAKGLLMTQQRLSEDEAYRAMRKMAMDQGKKISVVSQEIISVISGLLGQEVGQRAK